MQTLVSLNEEFIRTLVSNNRSAEIEDEEDIYARLLGNWKLKMIDYYPDGSTKRNGTGAWYFSRTLEGRAIQDLLVSPEPAYRSSGEPKTGNRYGNTFRMMDPKTRQWHVYWFNPVSGIHNQLAVHTEEDRIVQVTGEMDGLMMRWIFDRITPDSFHWYGESSSDKGHTWKLDAEFFADRIKK